MSEFSLGAMQMELGITQRVNEDLHRMLARRNERIRELEAEVERLKEFVADVRSIQPWREDDRGFISCIACGNEYAPHHSPICPFGRAWKEVEG